MDFNVRKLAALEALASDEKDRSRKGGVDAPIAALVNHINSHPFFFTTSSCSGRISLFLEQCELPDVNSNGVEKTRTKKGGDWLYVTHAPACADEVIRAVKEKYDHDQKGLLTFRFEPFILALDCYTLPAAKSLVTCAMAAGFRESGISSIGYRIIVAVRCSIRLEVPIADGGRMLVPMEYLSYISAMANNKMAMNQQRTDKFFSMFQDQLMGGLPERFDAAKEGEQGTLARSCRKPRAFNVQARYKILKCLEIRQVNILSKIGVLVDRLIHST